MNSPPRSSRQLRGRTSTRPPGVVVERRDAARLGHRLHEQGRRIVMTNGCFDLIHIGHLRYLQEARGFGDVLVIGVNSDESVEALKGEGRPIMPASERAELLVGFDCVDYAVIFNELDPVSLVREIQPDVLVKGADWPLDKVLGKDIVESGGGRVVTLPLVSGHSTSQIITSVMAQASR